MGRFDMFVEQGKTDHSAHQGMENAMLHPRSATHLQEPAPPCISMVPSAVSWSVLYPEPPRSHSMITFPVARHRGPKALPSRRPKPRRQWRARSDRWSRLLLTHGRRMASGWGGFQVVCFGAAFNARIQVPPLHRCMAVSRLCLTFANRLHRLQFGSGIFWRHTPIFRTLSLSRNGRGGW